MIDTAKEYEHAGMLDWLSLKVDLRLLPEPVVRKLQSLNSKLVKISGPGEIEWEAYAWDSIRSDTHQVCVKVAGALYLQGSPARVGLPNNVFGALDIRYCAAKMIAFAANHLDLPQLPPVEMWDCTRIDITRNYLMQSEAEARQALAYLKQSPESRQKHSFESQGFYIGKRSTLQRGKIYLKGQDAKRCRQARRAEYTDDQIHKSQRLLRSELTLARHFIRRLREQQGIDWHQLTPAHLLNLHDAYFDDYFSEIEVTDMSTVLEQILQVAPTEGRAKAAYDCYVRIRMIGYEQAKVSYTRTSWYRNIQYLKLAGFKRADLQMINVIPLQKRAIQVSQPVRHWDDIQVA